MPRSQAHQRTCKANEVHSCRKGSLALRATPTTPNNLQTLSLRSERLACGRSPCASPAASAGCARSMRRDCSAPALRGAGTLGNRYLVRALKATPSCIDHTYHSQSSICLKHASATLARAQYQEA